MTSPLQTVMPTGSPQLTQTWIETDGRHVVINIVEGMQKDRGFESDQRVALAVSAVSDAAGAIRQVWNNRRMLASTAVVVETTRGHCVETVSEVVAAVVDHRGNTVESYGAPAVFPARSTIKLLQGIPLVASGAAVGAGVSDAELALACASHEGEEGHTIAVEGWLARIGLSERDLQCGAVLPSANDVAAYLAAGGVASRLRHNCSGKHAGFLTLGAHLGADPTSYLRPDGIVQRQVLQTISDRCRVRLGDDDIAGDGCGAPAVCLALTNLAQGLASCLDATPRSPEAILVQAIADHPWLVGGSHSFDTWVSQETAGRVLTKVGADGMHVALVREAKACVAVKSLSGTRIPAQVALVEVLHRFGWLSDHEIARLPNPVVCDDSGNQVGDVRVRANQVGTP